MQFYSVLLTRKSSQLQWSSQVQESVTGDENIGTFVTMSNLGLVSTSPAGHDTTNKKQAINHLAFYTSVY